MSTPAAADENEVPRPCACNSVRRAARILARAYDAALEGSGLNITQLAVMRAVERHPGQPLTRVAEDLAMDRTSLYRSLAGLQRKRWISLSAGPDERARAASITAAGAAVIERAQPRWSGLQRRLRERFGEEPWRMLHEELRRLSQCAEDVSMEDHRL